MFPLRIPPMLVIRDAQFAAMAQTVLADFRAWMVPHLREHFAAELEGRTDAELLALVDAAVGRAMRRGVLGEEAYCLFTNLAVALGPEFDADPRYPWAARILDDASLGPPDVRVRVLADHAARWLESAEEAA
jgi:hypothetical protein